jgi:hypothetical protein
MKKMVLFLLSTTLLCSGAQTGSAFAAEPVFNDISGYWAEKEILAAHESGIVSGYPDGSFKPDKYVTRAEFAAILSQAFDLTRDTSVQYPDVAMHDWYAPYIGLDERFVKKNEFTNSDEFDGDYNLHRIDAYMAFVELLLEKTGQEIELPPPDEIYEEVKTKYQEIDYQTGDMSGKAQLFEYTWLVDHLELRNLEKPGTFYPHSGMSRAEVLWIIEDIQARLDADE